MSYDVTLFVPAGDAPLDEQYEAAVESEELPPDSQENRGRLRGLREGLAALDPSAKLEESSGGQVLLVSGGEKLPDMSADARRGNISMSMASDSHALYQALYEVLPVFAAQGYVAFDHQLGAFVKPRPTFRVFMEQFRSEFDSEAAFEKWLASDRDAPAAKPDAPPPAKKGFPFWGLYIGIVIVLVGAYKLHKAGYF